MKLLVAKSNEATNDQSTPHIFYTYNTNKLSIGASYGDYQLSKFSTKLQATQKTPPLRYSSTLDTLSWKRVACGITSGHYNSVKLA